MTKDWPTELIVALGTINVDASIKEGPGRFGIWLTDDAAEHLASYIRDIQHRIDQANLLSVLHGHGGSFQ